jgi:4-amino-4-deoxy-L-arabinose transferase-like glycosyltransferase
VNRLIDRVRQRPDLAVLIGVTVLGLLVRLVVLAVAVHHWRLSVDGTDYLRLGRSVSAGHGWGPSHTVRVGPEGLRAPGYPLFLAAVVHVTGRGVTTIRVVQAVLTSTVPLLVATISLRLGLGRRVAAVAGAIAAVLPSLVIAALAVMSESLFVPLSLGVIAAGLSYRARPRAWMLAAGGACLGLATLVRPVGVVLVVPFLVLAVTAPGGRRLGTAALAVVIAAAPCAAWEVRQVHAFHTLVPVNTEGGYLVAGTYDATSAHLAGQPGTWLPPNLDPTMDAVIEAHPNGNEAQVGSALQHAAAHYLRQHPAYLFTVLGHNTLRMFDLTSPSFEHTVTDSAYGVGPFGGAAEQIGAWILLALAAVGLVRGVVRRANWAVWAAPLLLAVVTIPVQSFTRFRAPVDPYLTIAAASCVVGVVRAAAQRRTQSSSSSRAA